MKDIYIYMSILHIYSLSSWNTLFSHFFFWKHTGVRKEKAQMNEKGMFHAGYGPPLDLPNTGSMSLQFGQPISLGKYAREHRRAAREAAAGDVAAGEVAAGEGGAGEGAAGEGAAGEKKSSKEETSTMVNDLAYHIMDTLHSTSVCHGTHLVASILVRFVFLIFGFQKYLLLSNLYTY